MRPGGQLGSPGVVARRLEDLLIPDVETGRDVPDGLGHGQAGRLGRQQFDQVERGPGAEQTVIVVDEVDEAVVDALVVGYVGIGPMNPDRFEQQLVERAALAVQLVVDLAGADLIAGQDALLQGGVTV